MNKYETTGALCLIIGIVVMFYLLNGGQLPDVVGGISKILTGMATLVKG